jgi:hypothetical protein
MRKKRRTHDDVEVDEAYEEDDGQEEKEEDEKKLDVEFLKKYEEQELASSSGSVWSSKGWTSSGSTWTSSGSTWESRVSAPGVESLKRQLVTHPRGSIVAAIDPQVKKKKELHWLVDPDFTPEVVDVDILIGAGHHMIWALL